MNEEKEVYFDQYCKSCKYHILDEKSLSATNVGALIIRNVRKRFVKPGNTTNRKINRLCKS